MSENETALPAAGTVPAQAGRRRQFTDAQKRAIIAETTIATNNVSSVARKYSISPSLLFRWKSALGSPTSLERGDREHADPRIRALQRKIERLEALLGQKTLELEMLSELMQAQYGVTLDSVINNVTR